MCTYVSASMRLYKQNGLSLDQIVTLNAVGPTYLSGRLVGLLKPVWICLLPSRSQPITVSQCVVGLM